MTEKKEEKLDITEVSVNKERLLTITHNASFVTSNGKQIRCKGAVLPGDQPVHEDLQTALKLLLPFMLTKVQIPGRETFAADYIKKKKALKDEELNRLVGEGNKAVQKGYYISGFSINDKGMLSIKGGIRAENGAVQPLNANNISLDPDQSTVFMFDELVSIIETICAECDHYFNHGKFGDGAQGDLFTPENEPETQDHKE